MFSSRSGMLFYQEWVNCHPDSYAEIHYAVSTSSIFFYRIFAYVCVSGKFLHLLSHQNSPTYKKFVDQLGTNS